MMFGCRSDERSRNSRASVRRSISASAVSGGAASFRPRAVPCTAVVSTGTVARAGSATCQMVDACAIPLAAWTLATVSSTDTMVAASGDDRRAGAYATVPAAVTSCGVGASARWSARRAPSH
ncbi:MAG: hypothetical protein QM820_51510 [Minicystis sp.]